METYNQLKSIEDEIIDYYIQIQKFNLSETESDLTANYLIKLRSMVIAAKNIKDVIPNIKEMSQSEDGLANEVFQRLQDFALQSLNNLNQIAKQGLEQSEISKTQSEYEKFYNSTIDFLYKSIREKAPIKVSVSSITNAIKKTVSSLEELTNSAINPISENKIKLIENLKG